MQEGKRYLVERNGVQNAGTYDGAHLISDNDGYQWYEDEYTVIRELTSLEAMKVGDVIAHPDGRETKVLAITNNHTAFLKSAWDDFDYVYSWYTFTEAKELGYKLKNQPEDITEITLEEIAQLKGVPVEKIRVKE